MIPKQDHQQQILELWQRQVRAFEQMADHTRSIRNAMYGVYATLFSIWCLLAFK